MKLVALTLDQCQQVRIWRNDCLETLRTPYPLTEEQQEKFFRDVICNRNSLHRYFALTDDAYLKGSPKHLIGMGGLIHIQWENSIAEISLILDPKMRGQGLGQKAVDLLLDQAFNSLNLKTVFGEVYLCNPAWKFWEHLANMGHNEKGCWVILPNRKYWNGCYQNSGYFSFDADDFRRVKNGS